MHTSIDQIVSDQTNNAQSQQTFHKSSLQSQGNIPINSTKQEITDSEIPNNMNTLIQQQNSSEFEFKHRIQDMQHFDISLEAQDVQRVLKVYCVETCFYRTYEECQQNLQKVAVYGYANLKDVPSCHKSHSMQQQTRRAPFNADGTLRYKAKLCKQIKEQNKPDQITPQDHQRYVVNCSQGDQCKYCHSQFEFDFHPQVFKTQQCQEYLLRGSCSKGFGICYQYHKSEESRYISSNNNQKVENQKFNDKSHASKTNVTSNTNYSNGRTASSTYEQASLKIQSKESGGLTNYDLSLITQQRTVHRKVSETMILGSSSQKNQIQSNNSGLYSPPHLNSRRKNTMGNMSSQRHQKHSSFQINPIGNSSQQRQQEQSYQTTGRVVPYFQPQLQNLSERQNSYYGTQNVQMAQCIPFLDLNLFKTVSCTSDPLGHNLKKCPYYHDYKKDRRRALGFYQSEKCWYVENHQECPYADNCDKAHNRVEEFYHPDKYKAKFCSSYLKKMKECEYGEFCSFAHSENELSVELIEKFEPDMDFYLFHFKTVWCPYREDDHERDVCVYAHNWQDYRRKPSIFNYSKDMCQNWHTKGFITSYKDGCQNEYRCQFSHGWKEQEFHPDYFKIKQCLHGEGCEKPHCPYYHSETDRKHTLSHWFKYFPKTRTVSFPTNFYVPVLGNVSVVHKQTSFSKMTTELICNQMILNEYQSQQQNHSPQNNLSPQNSFQTPQQQYDQQSQQRQMNNQAQPFQFNRSPKHVTQQHQNNLTQAQMQQMNSQGNIQLSQSPPMQREMVRQPLFVGQPTSYRKASEGNFYPQKSNYFFQTQGQQMQQPQMFMNNQGQLQHTYTSNSNQQLQVSPQMLNMNLNQMMMSPQQQYNQQQQQQLFQQQFMQQQQYQNQMSNIGMGQGSMMNPNASPLRTQTQVGPAFDQISLENQEKFLFGMSSAQSSFSTPSVYDIQQKLRKISCQSADQSLNGIFMSNEKYVMPKQQQQIGQISKHSSTSQSPTYEDKILIQHQQHQLQQQQQQQQYQAPQELVGRNSWQNNFRPGSFHQLLVDERDENLSEGSISSSDGGGKANRNNTKARILEIIAEKPSMDVQLNDEVYRFLQSIELEFLAENFNGEHSKISLQQLRELEDEKLEEILEGSMYVQRIKKELARLQSIDNSLPNVVNITAI